MSENIELIKEFKQALEGNVITFDEALNQIDKMIDTNPTLANCLLTELKKETKQHNNVFVKYLNCKIRDKRRDKSMSEEKRQEYESFLEQGRIALKSKHYDKAHEIFLEAFERTRLPIFKYYLGKTCFYSNKLDQAADYFNHYITLGSENFAKANLYLWSIAKKTYKAKSRDYRMAILYYLPKVFESEPSFDDLISRLTFIPNRERVLPSSLKVSEKISCTPSVAVQSQKETPKKMLSTETTPQKSYVEEEQEDKYADFYSFDFEDQMDIVHQLYLRGNILEADRLLKKAETSAAGNRKRQKAIKEEKNQRHVYMKKTNQN